MSGLVVAFANSKGGVGKTTLSTSLAVYLAATGKRVGVVALDPQSDLIEWHKRRTQAGHDPSVDVFRGADGLEDAARLSEDAGLDVVIVDCPPHLFEDVEQALAKADLVVIPVKGGGFDVMSKDSIMASVAALRVPHLIVINESPPNWKITKAVTKLLEADGHLVAEHDVQTRADYRAAPFKGLTAAEVEKGDDAATEAANLWVDIQAALKFWVQKRRAAARAGARS